MLKACIFDLDGVLTDTAEYHFQAWKEIAKELGYTLTIQDNEKLKGVSRSESLDRIISWAKPQYTPDFISKNILLQKKNEHYLRLVDALNPGDLFPGVTDFFREVKNAGLKIGLGSSSKNAVFILKKLQILDWFDAISDGNNYAFGKPNPDVFLMAAGMMSEEPQNCLVFEDAQAGVDAAVAAGMKCIGIGNPENLKGAIKHIPGLHEANLENYIALYQ